ncbi:hypothetical protein BD408DRAFT_432492 [Parasitella parasitica]|nr:hypothetical protein BD408DRAFT_432492 [Parasitella parasitica]
MPHSGRNSVVGGKRGRRPGAKNPNAGKRPQIKAYNSSQNQTISLSHFGADASSSGSNSNIEDSLTNPNNPANVAEIQPNDFAEENDSSDEAMRDTEEMQIDCDQSSEIKTYGIDIEYNGSEQEVDVDSGMFDRIEDDITRSADSSYITEYLKAIQEKFRRNEMPQAYKDGTFWYSNQAALKLKKDVNADQRNLLQPRVFLCFPRYLFYEADKKFKCPECSKNKAVPEFMNNDGYTKNPLARRIIDIKDCRTIGTDIELIRHLPIIAQAEFPAFLTKKSGISRDLADLMRHLVKSSTGPLRLSNILQELHTKRYDTLQYQYLANYKFRVDNPGLISLAVSAPEFSKFNDKNGYNGYCPSAKYISFVYTSLMEVFRQHLDNQIMKVDGSILKGDHTFKAASNISSIKNGVNVFDALYTDNVRSDPHFLEARLPSLLENVQHVDGLAIAVIPNNVNIFVNDTVQEINESCERILQDYSELLVLVHFKRFTNNGRSIARVSIATFNFEVFIFKIIANTFPIGLQRLFEDANINMIGHRLNALKSSLNEQ